MKQAEQNIYYTYFFVKKKKRKRKSEQYFIPLYVKKNLNVTIAYK